MSDAMESQKRRKAVWHAVLGAALGGILIGVLAWNVDFDDVVRTMSAAEPLPLLVGLIALAIDFLLRALRFWLMLRATTHRRLPFAPGIAPFIASFGVSDLLPLRLGDGMRVIWFSRRFDLPVGNVIGAMVVERAFDLGSIVLLSLCALEMAGPSIPWSLRHGVDTVLILAALASFLLIFAPELLYRLVSRLLNMLPPFRIGAACLEALRSAALAVRQIGSSWRLMGFAIASLLLWGIESIVVYSAWLSLGGDPVAVTGPTLAFALGMLATLVPGLPGHFGTFEFAAINALRVTGSGRAFATAVVLLAHLILWAPFVLFAVVWVPLSARSWRRNPSGKAAHNIQNAVP